MSPEKRKFEMLSPGNDNQTVKRRCIGKGPASLSSDGNRADNDSSSSPLSEIASEDEPIQALMDRMQFREAEREAIKEEFEPGYHRDRLEDQNLIDMISDNICGCRTGASLTSAGKTLTRINEICLNFLLLLLLPPGP